jgi:DNA-binding transcriptional ArsR family regulator
VPDTTRPPKPRDTTRPPKPRDASRPPDPRVASRPPDPRVTLLKELADPLRLRVVDRLGHRGPATVSELAAEQAVPLPQLSNHLRRLRDAGLVRVRRSGRHAVYELADPGLQALLPALDRVTGRVAPPAARPETAFTRARGCYDHLAGALGVALYAALRERGALRDLPDGTVELGPKAEETFAALDLDASALGGERRRFAFECFDATEHAPHLAGAVGDAVTAALEARGWIERAPETRVITLTPRGARRLRRTLGVQLGA